MYICPCDFIISKTDLFIYPYFICTSVRHQVRPLHSMHGLHLEIFLFKQFFFPGKNAGADAKARFCENENLAKSSSLSVKGGGTSFGSTFKRSNGANYSVISRGTLYVNTASPNFLVRAYAADQRLSADQAWKLGLAVLSDLWRLVNFKKNQE